MKKPLLTSLSLACLLATVACTPAITKMTGVETGNDQDTHGCIATAGYTWSALGKDCIRLWESGVALTNVRDESATSVAYIVSFEDNIDRELFLPESAESIILNESGSGWTDSKNSYLLSENAAGALELYNANGILLYRSEQ